jgi:hypothetical protein
MNDGAILIFLVIAAVVLAYIVGRKDGRESAKPEAK